MQIFELIYESFRYGDYEDKKIIIKDTEDIVRNLFNLHKLEAYDKEYTIYEDTKDEIEYGTLNEKWSYSLRITKVN